MGCPNSKEIDQVNKMGETDKNKLSRMLNIAKEKPDENFDLSGMIMINSTIYCDLIDKILKICFNYRMQSKGTAFRRICFMQSLKKGKSDFEGKSFIKIENRLQSTRFGAVENYRFEQ
jgi:hypothetical protein